RPVEGATAFVHPSHIHVTSDQVARALHVADERATPSARERACLGPSNAVVGITDKDRLVASEVVPGNIHSSIVGRRCVVIHPARSPVTMGAGVNTEMGPAIRVRGSGRLIPAETLTAAAPVQPDGVPGAVVALIQNDRVADGIGERALTAASG